MIEYLNWAKGQLNPDHVASTYDWQNMSMAEMANRARAICAVAREGEYRHNLDIVFAFQCLEKMAEAMIERYDYPRPRAW